ncbi:hypothetical protein NDU88_005141 [Pleurodeles waltl]|uniref:Uncharacterized protein n=1 Tax=Pleurodeles waltl TaxID=8319 RepID=A0AAV7NN37_PLEWA|nr:hypothetical protein NDU88_005141 [Pleurodeles waltl]
MRSARPLEGPTRLLKKNALRQKPVALRRRVEINTVNRESQQDCHKAIGACSQCRWKTRSVLQQHLLSQCVPIVTAIGVLKAAA